MKWDKLYEESTIRDYNNTMLPRYIAVGKMHNSGVDYPMIREYLKNMFENYVDRIADGAEKDVPGYNSMYCRIQLSNGKWMCLRVADHEGDIYKTYYQYTRELIPSSNEYANICMLFYSVLGVNSGANRKTKKYIFREDNEIPYIEMKQSEFEKFEPFRYTVYHYINELIQEKDLKSLATSLKTWFDNKGVIEFKNPLPDRTYQISKNKTDVLNPLSQVMYGTVKIRLKKENNELDENNIFVEGNIDDILIAYVNITDDSDNIIHSRELVYVIDKLKVFKSSPIKKTLDDVIDDNEIEYHKRLKKDLGVI